jgi:CDP-paratose 2-epimerase
MRILISGICGFVGSSVALRLRESLTDARISGIDNFSRPGSETNRPRLLSAGVHVTHGDVRCASDVDTLGPCDWIIDAAAIPTVLAGVDGETTSRQLVEHNLLGTVNLLEHARRHAAGLILLSSSRVYSIPALAGLPLAVKDEGFVLDAAAGLPLGCSEHGVSELFSTAAPVSLYGASKLASEALALEYGQTFGLPVVVNRCGVLAGATQFGVVVQGIFSFWIRSYASRRRLTYIGFGGGGHQVRDVLHPDDLTDLIVRQLQQPATGGRAVWNVGGGPANAMSLAQLSRWCALEFGQHTVERDTQPRRFDIPWMVIDSRQVSAACGWRPRIGVTAILDDIAGHHRRHPEWLDVSRPS